MLSSLLLGALATLAAAGAGAWVATVSRRLAAAAAGDRRLAAARDEAARAVRLARDEADRERRQAELGAREEALAARAAVEAEVEVADRAHEGRARALERAAAELAERAAAQAARGDSLAERERAGAERRAALQAAEAQLRALAEEGARRLEAAAGETAAQARGALVEGWVEQARSAGVSRVRAVEQGAADPAHGREARRLLDVSMQRYHGHYLTERLLTNVPLLPGAAERVVGAGGRLLDAIQEVSGARLTLGETGEAIRVEGQDGVGREVARRAIARLQKAPQVPREAEAEPAAWVKAIAENLEREIIDLGRRAFSELEIPRAHPEIVGLVGRLNYRTSYTQNQWKHAVEAAFLCGMLAEEMGLDVKLARRATLMHDIGKALTHQLDGSHAVIGADIARRLGEPEIVANAIGAHHTEEPFNSVYAYLVAACDALSGARPGARRQTDEAFNTRVQDLERIAAELPGVVRAYAVHGGREIRIHVSEQRVDDAACVRLSGEAARRISDELVFPGQIKVTVVRQFVAEELAG